MKRLPRKRKRRDRLFLLSILMFLNFDPAQASQVSQDSQVSQVTQALIYQDIRPQQQIFEDQKGIGETKKKEEQKEYLYDPAGMTDPFKSFIAIREEREAKKKKKPRTYLETLDLSSLNISIIVIGPNGKWAMVQDSKGLGHVIKEGTAIGTNGGVVDKIDAGEVIIREEYKDFRGRKKHRNISKKTPSLR